MIWLAPAIAAGASILGSLLANNANKKRAEEQREWNQEQWDKMNEWNHPQSVMQRYREAGLNTSLIYGMGNAAGGTASSPAQGVQAPTMENLMGGFRSSPLNDYISLKKADAEIENIQSETAKNLGQKDLTYLQGAGLKITNAQEFIELQKKTQTFGNYIAQSNLKTAADSINLVRLGLETKNLSIKNKTDLIELSWKQTEKILQNSKSYADLQGTWIGNKMKLSEYNYMKKHGLKMGTENPLIGLFKEFIANDAKGISQGLVGGVVNNLIKRQAQKKYNPKTGKFDMSWTKNYNRSWGGRPYFD